VVTPIDPIAATPVPKNTPSLQMIPTVTVWTVLPQVGIEFLPDQ
jgi:hypothetical protein